MEWISVKDRLPESGKPYLCFCEDYVLAYDILYFYNKGDIFNEESFWSDLFNRRCYNNKSGYITHWMPLPEPPHK